MKLSFYPDFARVPDDGVQATSFASIITFVKQLPTIVIPFKNGKIYPLLTSNENVRLNERDLFFETVKIIEGQNINLFNTSISSHRLNKMKIGPFGQAKSQITIYRVLLRSKFDAKDVIKSDEQISNSLKVKDEEIRLLLLDYKYARSNLEFQIMSSDTLTNAVLSLMYRSFHIVKRIDQL